MIQEPIDVGEIVLHHTADAYGIDFYPLGRISWHKWPDVHIGGLTVNLTPTKHVVFLVIAALLVFLTMKAAGWALAKQRAGQAAPKGFAAAMEGLVLWVRNDIAIANIGHDGAKFAPLVMTFFFFILYSNLIGLLPWGATPDRQHRGDRGACDHCLSRHRDRRLHQAGPQGVPPDHLPQGGGPGRAGGGRHVGRDGARSRSSASWSSRSRWRSGCSAT